MKAGLKPRCCGWLGAPAKYGMALPEAQPTAAQMYCPRGVYIDDKVILVADSGNHRLLGWKLSGSLPDRHSPADFVVGQPDFTSEGAKLLHLPTGLTMAQGCFLVADAWHHRILGWHGLPEKGDPDFVIGQENFDEVEPNRGGKPGANTLYWPYGVSYVAGRLYVADTGNRRVLYWNGLPQRGEPADGVIGQDDFTSNEENRGAIGNATFRWAHDISGDSKRLFIADAGNHRVLGWSQEHDPTADANLLLGQKTFEATEEYPYRQQSASAMRFPYGLSYISGIDDLLAVADTANNRVLLFENPPCEAVYHPAQAVIGQPDFVSNGENNWKAVTESSLCWPYGLDLKQFADGRRILAVADSGNNRVMLWEV